MKHQSALICLLVCMLSTNLAIAQQRYPAADGTPEIDQAIAQKNWAEALKRLDAQVNAQPRDVQAKFKRATVLARLGRKDDAITAYTALIQQYPELPEPYNNLAVLYAQRGHLEKARAMLETAITINPNFTLAYRNLGDLYLLLSSQAYQRAAAANPSDTTAAARPQQILKLMTSASASVASGASTPSAPLPASAAQPGQTLAPSSELTPDEKSSPSITPPYRAPHY